MDAGGIATIIGISLVGSMPIVAIITYHQRKMAEIVHRKSQKDAFSNEVLAAQVLELQQVVYQQSIAIDDLRSKTLSQPPEIRERLTGVAR